jgi:hypothetical protein
MAGVDGANCSFLRQGEEAVVACGGKEICKGKIEPCIKSYARAALTPGAHVAADLKPFMFDSMVGLIEPGLTVVCSPLKPAGRYSVEVVQVVGDVVVGRIVGPAPPAKAGPCYIYVNKVRRRAVVKCPGIGSVEVGLEEIDSLKEELARGRRPKQLLRRAHQIPRRHSSR